MSGQMTVEIYEELEAQLRQQGFEKTTMFSSRHDFGRWGCNEELTIAVTTEVGVVYTRKGRVDDTETLDILEKLCPKGRGEFVTGRLRVTLCPEADEVAR